MFILFLVSVFLSCSEVLGIRLPDVSALNKTATPRRLKIEWNEREGDDAKEITESSKPRRLKKELEPGYAQEVRTVDDRLDSDGRQKSRSMPSLCDRFNSDGFYVRAIECESKFGRFWTSNALRKNQKKSEQQIREAFRSCMKQNLGSGMAEAVPTSFFRFDMPVVSLRFIGGFVLGPGTKLQCAYPQDMGESLPVPRRCNRNKSPEDFAKMWYHLRKPGCGPTCEACKVGNFKVRDSAVGCCHQTIESMASMTKKFLQLNRDADSTCYASGVHNRPVGNNQCQVYYSAKDVVGIYYVSDDEASRTDANTLFDITRKMFPNKALEIVHISSVGFGNATSDRLGECTSMTMK
eukprot:gnl/TRDRNA2_/TRDRNA2_36438_c0_seq1.p1 gnl/TRDRNA2_/TRDRNA2_36438_c0~~gnl/TRDRNA2_/TRDRNA2_36438_c0_seq1.p1  ORF type:complete len:351 (+),score=43.22 gnl/TRDRNA2_/TRDRNA2_36438_c0_seq1:95-1147(+)